MVSKALTYSDLQRTLGDPGTAQVRPEGWTHQSASYKAAGGERKGRQVRTGGELDLGYPVLGLSFTIDREDRSLKDPPIHWMSVAAPATGRTPQGLHIGQPQDEVLAIARRHYEVLHERIEADHGSIQLADAAGDSPHRLWLELQHGTLQRMQFDFKPPPGVLRRWLPAVAMVLATGLAAWGLARLRQRIDFRIPAAGARTTTLVGKLVIGLGAMIGLASVAGFAATAFLLHGDHGGGWAGLGGLTVGESAATGLLLAVVLVLFGRKIARSA